MFPLSLASPQPDLGMLQGHSGLSRNTWISFPWQAPEHLFPACWWKVYSPKWEAVSDPLFAAIDSNIHSHFLRQLQFNIFQWEIFVSRHERFHRNPRCYTCGSFLWQLVWWFLQFGSQGETPHFCIWFMMYFLVSSGWPHSWQRICFLGLQFAHAWDQSCIFNCGCLLHPFQQFILGDQHRNPI